MQQRCAAVLLTLAVDLSATRCGQSRRVGFSSAGKCPPLSWFDAEFEALKKDYPTMIVIDIKDAQCENRQCVTEVNGSPIFRDVGHLNEYEAHEFGEESLRLKGNPFISNRSWRQIISGLRGRTSG